MLRHNIKLYSQNRVWEHSVKFLFLRKTQKNKHAIFSGRGIRHGQRGWGGDKWTYQKQARTNWQEPQETWNILNLIWSIEFSIIFFHSSKSGKSPTTKSVLCLSKWCSFFYSVIIVLKYQFFTEACLEIIWGFGGGGKTLGHIFQ